MLKRKAAVNMKYFIADFWHKHDTGVTFFMALIPYTIHYALGIIGMIAHIAYTVHKHYFLIKNNMKNKESKETTTDTGVRASVNDSEYAPIGRIGGVKKPFYGQTDVAPAKNEKK